ncbi:hypothetical protein OOT46_20065 [Aquabacterium sp. A7-Y]|uniref:hypothetical protein n=1 Tax=Aquabacterium sp. A7-Y TaxID=1349605 RepID=UPI00223DD80C|nr:hypothetical protein [Aquabacterium sp. A7-Y]MCW7540133.1 hypothetical protein [Aquabacterium sp. A7-Y]
MTSLWPWLALAGAGALHGLNPATGWMFAAAWGLHSRDRSQALRALIPIAIGHSTSVALVAATMALGLSMDRIVMQGLALGLLAVVAVVHRAGRSAGRAQAGQAGLALWSFMMSTVHGAGWMLVPALIPLCISDAPAREITSSGSLALALAAVAVHTAAMLLVTGLVATGICRGPDASAGLFRSLRQRAGSARPWNRTSPTRSS